MPILVLRELAENQYPLMPFAEVEDPDFLGDEMRRTSSVEEGEFLFLLEEPVETITADRRVVQVVDSVQLTPFQKVILEQYILHRKNAVQIAQMIAGMTIEMVHPKTIEAALSCAFYQMDEQDIH